MKNNKLTNRAIIIVIILILIISVLLWRQNDSNKTNKTNNISNQTSNNNTINSNQESNINSNINSNELSNSNSNNPSNSSNNTNNNPSNSNTTNIRSNNNKASNITSNIKSNKASNINNKSNTSNTIELNTNGSFSGIFQKNNMKIIIYQNSPKIHYRIINTDTGRQYIGKANIDNQKAIGTINYTYTFTLLKNGIQLSTTDPNKELSGNYLKTKNYTSSDYYSDYIGDLKYENSNYNGIFNGDKGTIKLYQANNKEVVIKMTINNKTYNKTLNINNGKLVHEDINGKITITISENKLNVESSSPSAVHPLFSATGTYIKNKKYTITEIINDRF